MQGWSKSTTYLSVGMMAIGFLVMVLGWNGAANVACVDCQIPYLLSAGLPGLALVGGGLTLAIIQEMRRTSLALQAKLDEVIAAGKDESEIVAFDESSLTPRAAAARRLAVGDPASN